MKHTTKRSKVEEIVIDFEDGCVVKLTKYNFKHIEWENSSYHWERDKLTVELNNGVSFILHVDNNADSNLLNDLNELINKR